MLIVGFDEPNFTGRRCRNEAFELDVVRLIDVVVGRTMTGT
jgi:hypothetical protein